jgi:hypothetical protein
MPFLNYDTFYEEEITCPKSGQNGYISSRQLRKNIGILTKNKPKYCLVN